MNKEIAKAIADVSKKINAVERKLDNFFNKKYGENKVAIISAEQALTDMDLRDIETQQTLTDMDLRIMELEMGGTE